MHADPRVDEQAPVLEPVGREERWKLARRALLSLVATTGAVLLADDLLDGFDVGDRALPVAFAISLVTALASPLVVRFALPLFVYTAGLASLVINAGVVLLVADLDQSVTVESFSTALIVSLVVTLVGMLMSWALALDDDATFMRAVVRRHARRRHRADGGPATPGLVMFEIDGCSHGVLQRAARAGYMPTVAGWLATGSHALHRWETDLSSQTGASQAGLLMGSSEGIVAFRWFERDRQRVVVSGRPRDAALIERRVSNGHGLLAPDGASRNNLLSGDAASTQMTLSTVLQGRRAGSSWTSYFASADNVGRTLFRAIADIAREVASTIAMRRRRVWPRLRKPWSYPFVRASTTVVMPDVTVDSVVADMVVGVPVVYATFVGYDEVAHHDGVERPSALQQLRALDRHLHRIEAARRYAARPYHIVVLSDHGQSQGATFAQRYGETLEAFVQRSVGGLHDVSARTSDEDSTAQVSGALTELVAPRPRLARLLHVDAALGDEQLQQSAPAPAREDDGSAGTVAVDDILVLASGNLGLVYLTGRPHRATVQEFDAACPGLIERLVAHPGIGIVVVATRAHGTVAVGAAGRTWLEDGRVEGADPLAAYGPRTLEQLRRHDAFEHMPDLLLLSTWWSEVDEVAAFEELIGSHGGLGGEQSQPFVLAPAGFSWPDQPVVGSAAVHHVLRGWIDELRLPGIHRSVPVRHTEHPSNAHDAPRDAATSTERAARGRGAPSRLARDGYDD